MFSSFCLCLIFTAYVYNNFALYFILVYMYFFFAALTPNIRYKKFGIISHRFIFYEFTKLIDVRYIQHWK